MPEDGRRVGMFRVICREWFVEQKVKRWMLKINNRE
jgi:hypothetical protein